MVQHPLLAQHNALRVTVEHLTPTMFPSIRLERMHPTDGKAYVLEHPIGTTRATAVARIVIADDLHGEQWAGIKTFLRGTVLELSDDAVASYIENLSVIFPGLNNVGTFYLEQWIDCGWKMKYYPAEEKTRWDP